MFESSLSASVMGVIRQERLLVLLVACSVVPFQLKELTMSNPSNNAAPWNKGKLIDQILPLKLKEIQVIRIRHAYSEDISGDLRLIGMNGIANHLVGESPTPATRTVSPNARCLCGCPWCRPVCPSQWITI